MEAPAAGPAGRPAAEWGGTAITAARRHSAEALTLALAVWLWLPWACSGRGERRDEPAGEPVSTSPAAPEHARPAEPRATSPARPAASAPALRRVHVFLSGRVQGVSFRWFTQSRALDLELTGWVKNLRDGRVEAVIEGPSEKVAKLLEKMARGPQAARVDKIDVRDEPYAGQFSTFDIIR